MKNKVAIIIFCLLTSLITHAQTLKADFKSDITGGCSPIIVNFQDLSTGNATGWSWDFGNGATSAKQNPSATYFDEGTYTVKLTVTNPNGTNTVTKVAYITVYLEPTADFKVDKRNGCTPAKFQFTDLSVSARGTNINGWKWDFGDGGTSTEQNPQYIYRTPGSFTVTLTIYNDKGCSKLITKPNYLDIIQGAVPSFDFANPTECSAPSTVKFTNSSTGPGTLTYNWKFGDGNTSTSVSPSNLYKANGKYPVSLAVTSSIGCSDTLVREVEIGKVKTDFTFADNACPKAPVQFNNTSSPRPEKVFWRFSTGATDTLRNPKTSFPAGGTYKVTLINTYSICTDSLTKTITVIPAPKISFAASDTAKCAPPLNVNFSNSSNGVSYTWNFGDSATATDNTPSHTYTKFGDYDVTLIGKSTNGCVDTLTRKAYIKIRKPIIKLPTLPANGCVPYPFNFVANITTVDSVVAYKWDFGDGGTSTEAKPTYTYTKQGTYDVTLTITTSGGCTETLTIPKGMKVGTMPTPLFTSDVTSACADPGIQFRNLTVDTFPPPGLEYFWKFSDGTTSTLKDPRQVFNNIGFITVSLTAINNGCENKITKTNYAFINPSVSKFDYKPDCNNKLLYTFTDKSIQALTWQWDFGDGIKYNGQNPGTHNFPSFGTYKVSLTTTNGSCTYTLVREIKIADFTPDFTSDIQSGCKPLGPVKFTPTAPDEKSIKSYVWDFGDGNTATSPSLDPFGYNTFVKTGNYNIKLTTVDTFGCKEVKIKNGYIHALGATPGFTSITNSGCKGMNVTFTDTSKTDGVNPIVSWTWDFGDSTIQNYTAGPFQHTYDSVGDYNVKLVIKDAGGCTDSVTYNEFVKVSTLKANWEIHTASCPNAPAWFGNLTTSEIPYTSIWSFGNGDTSHQKQLWYAFKDTGLYTIKLKVRDELGCEDSIFKKDAVHIAVPKADYDANNFTTYCTPFEAKFTNNSYFFNSSYWTLGPGKGTSTQTNPTTYYTTTGKYDIKLVVTSPGGCKDSVTNTLTVYNPGDGTIKYTPLLGCRPLPVSFEAFSPMKANYVWDFGDGNVIDTTVNKISHIYDNLGSFVPRIILKQPEGCLVPLVGDETVEIIGAKAMFRVNKNLFCDSGFVFIKDSTIHRDPVTKYTWDFGDGTSSNEIASQTHEYTSPGIYNVSLVVNTQTGCADTLVYKSVKVVESPSISLRGDSIICANDYIEYTGLFDRTDTSLVRWSWSFPNGNNSANQFPPLQQFKTPGAFSVTALATNSSGCIDSARQSLLVNPIPVITLPSSLTMQQGYPITIPATYSPNIASYTWSPVTGLSCTDCPQPIALPKINTRYKVAVVDSNGCKNVSNIQIVVLCKNANVFLPNTFSPNGDGNNDIFYVRGRGLDRVKSMRIFNRWGEVVFEKRDFPVNDPSVGWNGKFNGNNPKADVYIYQVEVFCDNSDVIRFEGNVALIQ